MRSTVGSLINCCGFWIAAIGIPGVLRCHVPLQILEGTRTAWANSMSHAVLNPRDATLGSGQAALGSLSQLPLARYLIVTLCDLLGKAISLAAQFIFGGWPRWIVRPVPIRATELNILIRFS